MHPWLRLHPTDDVVVSVAVNGLVPGDMVDGVAVQEVIPVGHKMATRDMGPGTQVRKHGFVIGQLTHGVKAGGHVHVHNLGMPPEDAPAGPLVSASVENESPRTFQGYRRVDGSVGVRNIVVVVGTVNCSATVVKAVCRMVQHLVDDRPDLHAIVPVTHGQGCAQAIGGAGHHSLNKTLAGWIFHPNVVGAVVIGLGCEGTDIRSILAERGGRREDLSPTHFNIQDSGGTAASIARGVREVSSLVQALPRLSRQPVPVSALRLALNCGGSDGFSGITANVVLGKTSDLLVAQGAGVALAEVPECTGCEPQLAARTDDAEVKARLARTFAWWRNHLAGHGVAVNDNLSPGNIAGGISTIVEKSMGAIIKAGGSPLTDVVAYSEPLARPGFVLMDTPGYDPASVTGLVAGGAQLVAFTTGRGSVFGAAIAPTIKLSTNTALAQKMPGDIDFDAGRLLESADANALGRALYEQILRVASGEPTSSELLGLGWEEFVPWALGATL